MSARTGSILIGVTTVFLLLLSSTLLEGQGASNYLINGRFEDGLCFASYPCTTGWSLFTNGIVGAQTLAKVTSQPLDPGGHALELRVGKTSYNLSVTAVQFLNRTGCQGPLNMRFGLAMQKGLTLSLWYREVNLTGESFVATVTFHNGTSKLSMSYHLEPTTLPVVRVYGLNLASRWGGGGAEVYLASSTTYWKESTFNLYQEFAKYFGIDPIVHHYCVNYVALGLEQGRSGPAPGSSGPYAYGYFDDVNLYLAT